MAFPEVIKSMKMQMIPINGAGLFYTDSCAVEFVSLNQRERFPLIYNPASDTPPLYLDKGDAHCIPIEAHGFMSISPGAAFSLLESEPFTRLRFRPNEVGLVSFLFPPFVVSIIEVDPAQALINNGIAVVIKINTKYGDAFQQFKYTPRPATLESVDALVSSVFKIGDAYNDQNYYSNLGFEIY